MKHVSKTPLESFTGLQKFGVVLFVIALSAGMYFGIRAQGDTKINLTLTSQPSLEDGLVGHWTFDGNDMLTNVADRSGNGYDGDLLGQTSTTTTAGAIGQASEFKNYESVLIGPATADLQPADITVSMWVRRKASWSNKSGAFIGAKSGAWTTNGWYMEVYPPTNEILNFVVDGPNYLTYTAGTVDAFYPLNEWVHIAATFSSDTNIGHLYRNGESLPVTTAGAPESITQTGTDVAIHRYGDFDAGPGLPVGTDDVRIYNRALSADEIVRLYKLGATTILNTTITTEAPLEGGLVGHYTFDGPDMLTNVADRSGNANHGALSGQTSTTTAFGAIGQALEFDGSDDHVEIAPFSNLPSSEITVSAWVYIDAYHGSNFLSIVRKSWTSEGAWALYSDDVGGLQRVLFGIHNGGNSARSVSVPSREWHHLVGTYDGTTVRVYVDTIQGTPDTTTGDVASTGGISIGANVDASAPFDGVIDDVRIYNRVLSGDEIVRLYKLGNF